MKKLQLKKIIRESIKKLINEQITPVPPSNSQSKKSFITHPADLIKKVPRAKTTNKTIFGSPSVRT